MEITKWKKRQGAEDRVAEVAQEEHPEVNPDPGSVLEEEDAVDPAAGNADVLVPEEDANEPLQESEEGVDVPQSRVKWNKYFCQHPLNFNRFQDSFWK